MSTAPIGPGHNPNPAAAPPRGAMPAINGLGVGVGVNGLGVGVNGLGALGGIVPPGVGVGSVGLPPFQQTMHLAHHPNPQQQYLYGTNADEFLLNPPPTTAAQQQGLYATQFTFSPVYTQGQGQGSASPTTHSQSDSEDYASKYRANQAELFRSRNDWNSWSGSESESELPGAGRGSLDKDMQAVLARQLYQQQHGDGVGYGYYRGGERGSGEDSGTGSASSSSVNLSLDGHGTAGRSGAGGSYRFYQEYLINHHNTNAHQRHPSSSSSASPPLSISQTSQSSRPGTSHSQHSQHAPEYRPGTSSGHGEGGFSSAFGLMSLDDPNVLAGLANDGQPFFSDVMDSLGVPGAGDVDDNTTPMPRGFDNPNGHVNHLISVSNSNSGRPSTSSGYTGYAGGMGGNAQTPGSREQETRELREFWKAYMRTPLTGPQGAPAGVDVNMLSPGPSYRRQRVSSLPSAKTPTMDDRVGYILPSTNNTNAANSNNANGNANGAAAGGYGYTKSQSNPNTSIILPPPNQQAGVGNADDLRSYEAAVLARKAPTNLNLVPRNRRKPTLPSSSDGQGGQKVTFAPGSDAGVNGVNGTGAANGGGGSSPGKRRPSFKRLASQTLEPENSKRWRDGSEDPDDGDDEGDDDADPDAEDEEGSVGSTSVSPQPLQQQQHTTIGRKSDPHNRSTYHHQPQFGFPVGGQQHEFALGLGVGGGGGGGYPSAAAAPM
ncbi:hypothetical protein VNI00_008150 [Paramarasmius palmivorus]|uniref:Uncharacterized protein n=1 Tax=Paramarasmius palmivorus TaxID=297713 RepID=A0AAW0CYZ1_9AGAR